MKEVTVEAKGSGLGVRRGFVFLVFGVELRFGAFA
jgi:hypothetical protein